MAKGKRFKDYDAKYAKLKGTALTCIEAALGKVHSSDISSITKWDTTSLRYVTYPPETVHWAVYEHCYAEEWQQFRVSLKGLSTKEKLYCLAWRWAHGSQTHEEEVRINNYLGALIRGGCLSTTFEVIR